MKNIYLKHLEEASNIENKSERLTHLTSTLRSLLQLAVITSFELTKAQTPYDEINLVELTNRFLKPVDGLPLQILDHLTPVLRSYISRDFLTGWFEATKSAEEPLSKKLTQWVEFRNKRPGHGVLDTSITEEWAKKTEEIIKDSIIVFEQIIPFIDEKNSLKLHKNFKNLRIETPVFHENHAFVIMSIFPKRGIWKLKGQLLSNENAKEFTIDLPEDNLFSSQGIKSAGRYQLIDFISQNTEKCFFHNIPIRQTNIFEGREKEIEKLQEWMDDEDSRSYAPT